MTDKNKKNYWILNTVVMNSSDDGIVDPLSMKTESKLCQNFNEGATDFRSMITKHIDPETDIPNFIEYCKLEEIADEEDIEDEEDIDDDEDIDAADEMITSLLSSILGGKSDSIASVKSMDGLTVTGAKINIQCDYAGDLKFSMSGGYGYQPILKTNCANITDSSLKYYFFMENWFEDDHIVLSIDLIPVTV